jgi:hypothetical protein
MSNDEFSSVEWLVEILGKYNEEMVFLYQNEIEQAKAMHKEEIIRARLSLDRSNMSDFPKALNNATDYYNETFGGNNENI